MWRTKKYEWTSNGSKFTAHIELEFWPELPVDTGRIGLVQTVKTLRSTTADKTVSTPTFVRGGTNEQLSLPAGSGDRGRAIDQPSRITTDTSPLYATQGDGAKTLAGAVEAAGFGTFGHPRGPAAPAAPATMTDDPDFLREFDAQEWVQTFEVTALVLDGPLANEYLGSIEWGWRCEGGKVRMDPNPIRVLRQGPPTAQFMEAAKRWNDAQVRGEDTVDLPLVSSDAGALSTFDLGKRVVEARQAGAGDERTKFELLALEQELKRRNVRVVVSLKDTGDWFGPDNLYVRLAGKRPNGKVTKDIRANQGPVEFLVPIEAFASTTPLNDPVKVELGATRRTRSA